MLFRNLQTIAEKALNQFPAVAILGPRQVGKTTLAKAIAAKGTGFLYLDVENPRDLFKLQDSYDYLENLSASCIIIDEVQLLPALFSVLRPLIDQNRRPGRFILLGSASPIFIKGVSETLAGRIAYLELTGFNLTELSPDVDYRDHWFQGGFPDSILSVTKNESIAWLDYFVRSYIERDLAHLFSAELSQTVLRNFWTMLANSNGNVWNAEVYARSLGLTAPTILRYISFMEGAYLVRRLQPWHINIKKRLVKSPKIYLRDTGIAHRLLAIPNYDMLLGNPAVGASWEAYVIEQIYQKKNPDLQMFYYRTQSGAECDLVLVRGISAIACIEIKLSNTPSISKGFLISCDDIKPVFRYIITPESEFFTISNGIQLTGIRYFLTDLLLSL